MESYLIELDKIGSFEMESNDIFYAINFLKNELKLSSEDFRIKKVSIIKEDNSQLEITELLNIN